MYSLIYSYIHYIFILALFTWTAIEACHGLCHLGFSAHGKEYCRDWSYSFVRDAEEFSGLIAIQYCFPLSESLCILLFNVFCLQASGFCNQFHRTYFLTIEQEIFAVLTDTFHKPGFKLHVLILQHLFCLVSYSAHVCLFQLFSLLLKFDCWVYARWILEH